MRILAVDTSSQSASAALYEEDLVLGECCTNAKITHSQTIMPMIEHLLEITSSRLEQVDALAVTWGPGSFTGLRIGLSAVKGMAFALDKPCIGVSTLEALAYGLSGFTGTICAVMDARCRQVYTALFDAAGGSPRRRTEDMAISLEELEEQLKTCPRPIFLVGDGAKLCYNCFGNKLDGLTLAPAHLRFQRAAAVAMAAACRQETEGTCTASELRPVYLRLPQAERELRAKQSASQMKQKG